MALIEVEDGATRQVPLAASTLIGRQANCTWVLNQPAIPLYWLEIRWTSPRWQYRVLANEALTRGPTRRLPGAADGWFTITAGNSIHGPGATVRMVDDRPPATFAVDLRTGSAVPASQLEDVLEENANGWWSTDAEVRDDLEGPLTEGQIVVVGAQLLRVHLAAAPEGTVGHRVDLQRPTCMLDVTADETEPLITVLERDAEIACSGPVSRILLPYAEALAADVPTGGWLDIDAAHAGWIARGGPASSGRLRISQERSRLCARLRSLGVANANGLFETRRDGSRWVTRLAVARSRLQWTDLDAAATL